MLRARERTLARAAVGGRRGPGADLRLGGGGGAAGRRVPADVRRLRHHDMRQLRDRAPRPPRSSADGVAIYLDDAAPARLHPDRAATTSATLFDAHLYPIDTTAFGRGIGPRRQRRRHRPADPARERPLPRLQYHRQRHPRLLLRPRSAAPSQDHSNDGEVFYGAVPRDAPGCSAYTKANVTRSQPGVFIHEFQHMISFNQHVLVRGGNVEETWLNEGLSHFAEELGGAPGAGRRSVPRPPSARTSFSATICSTPTATWTTPSRPFSWRRRRPEVRSRSAGRPGCSCGGWRDHFAATQPLAPRADPRTRC